MRSQGHNALRLRGGAGARALCGPSLCYCLGCAYTTAHLQAFMLTPAFPPKDLFELLLIFQSGFRRHCLWVAFPRPGLAPKGLPLTRLEAPVGSRVHPVGPGMKGTLLRVTCQSQAEPSSPSSGPFCEGLLGKPAGIYHVFSRILCPSCASDWPPGLEGQPFESRVLLMCLHIPREPPTRNNAGAQLVILLVG